MTSNTKVDDDAAGIRISGMMLEARSAEVEPRPDVKHAATAGPDVEILP